MQLMIGFSISPTRITASSSVDTAIWSPRSRFSIALCLYRGSASQYFATTVSTMTWSDNSDFGTMADSGGTPDRRSRIEPTHACAILEDDPCAEKAYTRDHIRDDPSAFGRIIVEQQTAHHKSCGSGCHQSIGTGSRHALPPLSFEAYDRAHADSQPKTQSELNSADSDHVILHLLFSKV
jgi:hypothetical protein